VKVQSKRKTARNPLRMIPDEELLTYRFLPLNMSKVDHAGAFAYVHIERKGEEDIAVMEFGEKGKFEERNHVGYRKNLEIVTNLDRTNFERIRGKYFHKNIYRTGSNDGKQPKLISERRETIKEGKSDVPTVAMRFLWNRNTKTIQIFVQIEGKEFPLS